MDFFERECTLQSASALMEKVISLLESTKDCSGLVDLAEELKFYIEDAQEFVSD